jgi:hypothetical protein
MEGGIVRSPRVRRAWALAAALGCAWGAPIAALAQGVTIRHDEVGCIVAEQFPRLTACFDPRSRVARARVYFRVDGTIHWYYVDMTSDAPCFRGVLPKPLRSIHRLNYYVEALDRSFAESRTPEYAPDVVPDEAGCGKGLLAPFVHKAAVVVGSTAGASAIPQGFLGAGLAGAGGLSAGAILGVVGGGAALAGGIAAGAGGGGGDPPSTTPGTSPPGVPTTTAAAPPTATPATTVPGSPTTTVPG